jgi:CRISPR/Cas system-associated exonuclease Cas4 (RecB family)
MTAKPIAWSYSALTAYETCPRRYYLTRIAKTVVEGQSQAMKDGNEAHKALELAGKGEMPLPKKYQSFQPVLDKVVAMPGENMFEYKFALTRTLQSTTYFAKDVWVRGVFDVASVNEATAVVLDYKTGKPKTDGDQMKLFAGCAFALYPDVTKVKTGYIWLGHNRFDHETFTREDNSDIWKEFSIRVHRLEKSAVEDDWPPRPSGLCRSWCPVGKKLCEFCGD